MEQNLKILHENEVNHIDYVSDIVDDFELIYALSKYINKKKIYMMFIDYHTRLMRRTYDYKIILTNLRIIYKIGKDLIDDIILAKKEAVTMLEKIDRSYKYSKNIILLRDVLVNNTINLEKISTPFYVKIDKIINEAIDGNYPNRYYIGKDHDNREEMILLLNMYSQQIQIKPFVKSSL